MVVDCFLFVCFLPPFGDVGSKMQGFDFSIFFFLTRF